MISYVSPCVAAYAIGKTAKNRTLKLVTPLTTYRRGDAYAIKAAPITDYVPQALHALRRGNSQGIQPELKQI